jgi:signal transduction histidine kinase
MLAENNLEQVQRLQLLTETIMGVLSERQHQKTFEFVNVYLLLQEARELFAAEADLKGCEILKPKPIGDDRFPVIEMSRFDLGIAIKNIVHNAVKYSFHPAKGADKKRYVNIWGIWNSRNHQIYKINIQNYGVGISQEEIDKRLIFKAYYRGDKANDRRRTGAGFGLAHARQVIEDMHNGKIEVTSIPSDVGEGYQTTFTIYLPVIHTTQNK